MLEQRYRLFLFLLCLVFCIHCDLPSKQKTCGPTSTVKISETLLSSTLTVGEQIDNWGFYFASDNNQVVFVRTTKGNVFRSENEGYSWSQINTTESGGVSRIRTVETKIGANVTVYLLGTQGGLYSSQDSGLTFTYYGSHTFADVRPHSSLAGYALATSSSSTPYILYQTTNYGQSWVIILDKVYQSYWNVFDKTPDNRIYALVPDNTQLTAIIYSEDYFKTYHKLEPVYVLGMWVISPNKFVVLSCDTSTLNCESYKLYVSDDSGATWNLQRFPDLNDDVEEEKNLLIYELSDDAIWAFVKKDCTSNDCYGDLLHSNAAYSDFALALQNSVQWDFTKYEALDGIYLVNQFITQGGKPQSDDDQRSLITFNKGSEWNIIQAPLKDSNGQLTECLLENGCSLHVHGYRPDHPFTFFYSIPNAPGLMVASGNTGTTLELLSNTYISWNGGKNWTEVRKGNYVPEIGNFGTAIIMVQEGSTVDNVIYTLDDGYEGWLNCTFTDSPFQVTNIRVDPEWDSKRFLLYGTRNVNGVNLPVIAQLDFTNEYSGECTGSDLDQWSPTDEHGYCVMGLAQNFYQRKTGKKCYFGDGHIPEIGSQRCNCTEYDFECDHCFYRPELNSPCTLECHVPSLPAPTIECDTEEYYYADVGYRLVDNSQCILQPDTPKPKGRIPCPQTSPQTPAPSMIGALPVVLVIIVLIAGIAALIYVLYKKNESFRDFITYTLGFNISDTSTDSAYSTVGQGDSLST